MNKKGFTLIELLAVIVILAIIMVIAVPQILNVINKTRENAHKNSLELLKHGIQTQIASSEITNNNPFTKDNDDSGCYTFDFDNKNSNYEALNVKNKDTFTGTLKYCNGTFTGDAIVDGASSSSPTVQINQDYVVSEANTVICTLGGRSYYKSYDGEAYVGYYYNGTYGHPILVSENEDSVSFKTASYATSTKYNSTGTIQYKGKTYYISSYEMAMPSSVSTGGVGLKIGDVIDYEDAALLLIKTARNELN